MNLTSICYDIVKDNPSLEKELNNFKQDLKTFMAYAHGSLGKSIRNQLKLWDKNSQHYKFFNETYKLEHADDMSGIILRKLYLMYNETWIPNVLKSYFDHWEKTKNQYNTFV